jgi:hypothetical protein
MICNRGQGPVMHTAAQGPLTFVCFATRSISPSNGRGHRDRHELRVRSKGVPSHGICGSHSIETTDPTGIIAHFTEANGTPKGMNEDFMDSREARE